MKCIAIGFSASSRCKKWLSLIAGIALSSLFAAVIRAEGIASESNLPTLEPVIAELREVLQIANPIDVLIVRQNDLLVSVTPNPEDKQRFRISFDRRFLSRLTDKEIRAAVAHELGHVWIFTHHPYLQTEELADGIAIRAVPQADLDQIHDKTRTYLSERDLDSKYRSDIKSFEAGLGRPPSRDRKPQTVDDSH